MFKKTELPGKCAGCERILPEINMCGVYPYPHRLTWARHDQYCPFNPEKVVEQKAKFVNPIKKSKRGK